MDSDHEGAVESVHINGLGRDTRIPCNDRLSLAALILFPFSLLWVRHLYKSGAYFIYG